MKLERLGIMSAPHPGFGSGEGTFNETEYKCICGQGKVIYYFDDIPGFKNRDIVIECDECKLKYDAKRINGEMHLVEKE